MKTLLIGINAKFIHSNLAIRSIQKYAKEINNLNIEIAEYTINQRCEFILQEIYKQKPDFLGFSCYIWNFELIKRLCNEIKKILPKTIICLGGPEVSFNAKEVLENTYADLVIMGEGEEIFSNLILSMNDTPILKEEILSNILGIAYKINDKIATNNQANPPQMDDLPFVYEDIEDLDHKIIYYESSRGCPFRCQYCLSGAGSRVRTLSLDRVFSDLKFFLDKKVRQVKFVDRTFNFDKKYALSIWKFLHENDNGYTNFHFEIAAELLDDEIIDFLKNVRKGFFQFEIGVQSTNPKTLEHIKRITKIDKLRIIINKLQQANNIHLHLDLIIGLPYEDYKTFSKSFDDVYSLSPDQLQVGFLKLLKGSGLYNNKDKYGIVCSEYAPYEVLYTNDLPYSDLLKLKALEEMVEIYYNSNRFILLVKYLVSLFDSPFKMFESLANFYTQEKYYTMSHTNIAYYTILYKFFKSLNKGDEYLFKWYAKFDIYSHEKAKKLPDWLDNDLSKDYKNLCYEFLDNEDNITKYLPEYKDFDTKQIYRQAHIEVFPFNPISNENIVTPILYNYKNCDLLGNAKYEIIKL